MINLLFNILLFIIFLGIILYTFFYNKKHIWKLVLLTILSFVLINFLDWKYSSIAFILLILPIFFYKRLSYSMLVSISMIGSLLGAFFVLNYYLNYDNNFMILFGILSVVFICVMAIYGIFHNNIIKFFIASNLIQFAFVFLDLSVADLTGKISTLGVIQIFNYVIAGTLLFITIGILNEENKFKYISQMQGYYYRDPHIAIFACIAAISLAGLPGLNIFVSEWLLFKTSFGINPIITIWGIFAALLLFIMYFKIVYIMLSGRRVKREKAHFTLQLYNWMLGLAAVIFGILPFTQLYILGLFI
ncbi:MAG: hypothetical protein KKA79_05490 [Nanoarchaeota archaeon]|nr:hypothetical protein [Nanoarchaeota archaeon]